MTPPNQHTVLQNVITSCANSEGSMQHEACRLGVDGLKGLQPDHLTCCANHPISAVVWNGDDKLHADSVKVNLAGLSRPFLVSQTCKLANLSVRG
jgi:hypothetical protein